MWTILKIAGATVHNPVYDLENSGRVAHITPVQHHFFKSTVNYPDSVGVLPFATPGRAQVTRS